MNYKNLETLSNVEISYSSTLPLSIILSHCCYNITLWSSVCIDALEFDVRSIIIHEEGKQIYSDEIKEEVFDYCDNEKDLMKLIQSKKSVDNYKKMITDSAKIKENLNQFVSDHV